MISFKCLVYYSRRRGLIVDQVYNFSIYLCLKFINDLYDLLLIIKFNKFYDKGVKVVRMPTVYHETDTNKRIIDGINYDDDDEILLQYS